ncbi:hypothetical protein [Micromonospora sp. NPDC004704]
MTDDGGLTGLDVVPWRALHHAYGSAIDVPDQLRGLRSPERDIRHAALNQLFGSVYHQGTRWQASCHTVRFLVALVDDPATPDRASVLGLLRAVGVGDRRDDHLPFRPDRTFADADAVGDEQLAELCGGSTTATTRTPTAR